jgi:hypothetical protein
MLPVVLPENKLVFIEVFHCQVMVSRYIHIEGDELFTYEVERAANWRDLEANATAAVRAMGGSLKQNNHYPCPTALAALAVWESES